jgi:phage protein D
MADTYRFSYAIPNDNFRLPRLVQRGESDWSLLVKTASKLGYVVTYHGTNLHVYSPTKALGRGLPYVELTTPSQQNIGYAPGRILEFDGEFTPSMGGDNKTVHFLDSAGNNFSLSSSELQNSGLTTTSSLWSRISEEEVIPASSYEEAEKALISMETLQFSFSAQVTVTGVPFLVPGSIVNISKYQLDFDGVWIVRSVRHVIVRESFFTFLTISRNTLNSDPLRMPSVSQFKNPPSPLLIGDKWKAKVSVREHYD